MPAPRPQELPPPSPARRTRPALTGRRWPWVVGLLAVALLGLAIPREPDQLGLILLALLLAVALFGLATEVAGLARPRRPSPRSRPSGTGEPADGRVELRPLAGVVAEPYPHDPRFRRFVALDPSAAVPDRPAPSGPPPLLGRVAIFSVFLGQDGRAWSDDEIARAHDALIRAGGWLEREAMRWGAPLQVELVDTDFVADDPEPDEVEIAFVPEGDGAAPFEVHATTKALTAFSRAAARLGFADAADLIARAGRRVEADARVWLLHPRRAGRSHAVPEADTPWPGVSLAIAYAREASFPEPLAGPPRPDAVTYAHELLHLFGAT